MGYKSGHIDSCTLKSYVNNLHTDSEDYSILFYNKNSKEDNHEWYNQFGKRIPRNYPSTMILYHMSGAAIPIKVMRTKIGFLHTIEFAGLEQYSEKKMQKAIEKKEALRGLESQLKNWSLGRVDIAIDYYGDLPDHIKRALRKLDRKIFKIGNTSYYKTPKEKKVNQYLNIVVYDKREKDKLDFPCTRLEFSFRGSYFKGLQLKDLDEAIKKMEKSIKKYLDLTIKIESI